MSQKDEPELVTSGPYHLVRHPIYSGILVAGFGTAVALSWLWIIPVALAGVYFAYSATVEERYLTEQFPDDLPALPARDQDARAVPRLRGRVGSCHQPQGQRIARTSAELRAGCPMSEPADADNVARQPDSQARIPYFDTRQWRAKAEVVGCAVLGQRGAANAVMRPRRIGVVWRRGHRVGAGRWFWQG